VQIYVVGMNYGAQFVMQLLIIGLNKQKFCQD
jgi:hypothetical protein